MSHEAQNHIHRETHDQPKMHGKLAPRPPLRQPAATVAAHARQPPPRLPSPRSHLHHRPRRARHRRPPPQQRRVMSSRRIVRSIRGGVGQGRVSDCRCRATDRFQCCAMAAPHRRAPYGSRTPAAPCACRHAMYVSRSSVPRSVCRYAWMFACSHGSDASSGEASSASPHPLSPPRHTMVTGRKGDNPRTVLGSSVCRRAAVAAAR